MVFLPQISNQSSTQVKRSSTFYDDGVFIHVSPQVDLFMNDSAVNNHYSNIYKESAGFGNKADLYEEVKIGEIQGPADEAALLNNTVITGGVVTGMFKGVEPYIGAGFNGNLEGFFMQDMEGDENPMTSDAIFVLTSESVSVGDSVMLAGLVMESFGLTVIDEVSLLEIKSTGHPLPMATNLTLPLDSVGSFEKYESMLITISNELTVTENRNLENFGEVRLSANGLLVQPTQMVDPNDSDPEGTTASGNSNVSAVMQKQELNLASNLILDDARTGSNPDPIPFTDAYGNLLAGTMVSGLTGILSYGFNNYRIIPLEPPVFDYAERQNVPEIPEASLKVAAFNVLNYFNGDGQRGGFPTSRGASTYEAFLNQTSKIVAALTELDADIIGLMEIENDADDGFSAIKDLTDALNTHIGENVYDFVSTGIISPATAISDEIKVGLLYKTSTVELSGNYAILNNNFDVAFNDNYNRPALAQTFEEIETGEKLTVVVNHLKSKGSGCDDLGDPDDSDGQGNCNITRTITAGTLVSWLETDPTGSNDDDFLIIGDLNAYGQEDPIDTLRARGYESVLPVESFTYVFGGQYGSLDYGMANANLREQVSGAAVWNINSIEPDMYEYDGLMSKFNADPYRSSDHDPIIVGLSLNELVTTERVLFDRNTRVYPIPFQDFLTVKVRTTQKMELTVEIKNSVGTVVSQKQFKVESGLSKLMLEDLSSLENGSYILTITELNVSKLLIK